MNGTHGLKAVLASLLLLWAAPATSQFIQNQTALQPDANFNIGGSGRIGGTLGVGTTAPEHQLQVLNPAGSSKVTIGGTSTTGGFTSLILGTSELRNGFSEIQSVRSSGTAFGELVLNRSGGDVRIGGDGGRPGVIVQDGRIGIGAPPVFHLDIQGPAPAIALRDTQPGGKAGVIGQANGALVVAPGGLLGGLSAVFDAATNNVGLGVQKPGRRLDVADRIRVREGGAGTAGMFMSAADGNELAFVGMADRDRVGFWGNVAGWAMTMDRNTGATTVKVLKITGGSDLAEDFEVSESVEPGMVVAIDPRHPGRLMLARGAYNRRAAGIVSGANELNAGMVLSGHRSEAGAMAVALTGRVWTYCDATSGAIEPGDLLTTSATPGHAMRVRDHARAQGAIVGKALTGLRSGRGLVLVLATLQ